MKQTERYTYPARFSTQLHGMIKGLAKEAQRSMNAQIAHMLAESLQRFPVLHTLPVVLHQADQPFGVRIPHQLHEDLAIAAESASKGRSFNQEIVGRLMVMAPTSRQALIESWEQLNQALTALIDQGTPQQSCQEELRGRRESFEWQLKHTLAVEAISLSQ